MRKYLVYIIILILTYLSVNLLYLWILPGIDWEFAKTKEATDFNGEDIQILVFGNSTAMDGVNTELLSDRFGSAYNFAIGGASFETNYIQLKKYIESNDIPQRVILCLSSCHKYFSSGINPIVNHYYKNKIEIKGLKDLPLFKFRWKFIESFKKIISSSHRSAYLAKGQLIMNKIIKDTTSYINNCDSRPKSVDYLNSEYDYIWNIADLCQKNGIIFEVFELPCWKNAQNNYPDTTISRSGHPGINFYNLNNFNICDTLLNSKTDWLSENHLNFNGSKQITKAIIKFLIENKTH